MSSVIGQRHRVQPLLLIFGLLVAVLVGCAPSPTQKPKAPEKPRGEASSASTTAAGTKAPEKPAEAQPAEKPSEKPADAQPAEKPAEKPAEAQPAEKPSEKPADAQPAEKPAEKPAEAQPAEKPAEKPAEQPAAAPAEKPAEGPAPAALQGPNPTDEPITKWMPEPVANPDADAKAEADMKAYTEQIPDTDMKFDLLPIRGGKFAMGSPQNEAKRKDDEGPQHEVEIEPFWMGKYEVTWAEYELWGLSLDKQRREKQREASGAQPSDREKLIDAIARPTNPYSDMSFGMGKDNYPAICMTQLAAIGYCRWLSAKTGRLYRLPTEAEWEYACRAGTTTAYSFGDDPKALGDYAWYYENSDDKYHKVGQKKPNPWGLHDMHGNAQEWVIDQYVADYYKQSAGQTVKNPVAPQSGEFPRSVRGGCWDDDPELLRSAARRASTKDWKMQDPQIPQSIWYVTEVYCPGFRVVRPLRMPTEEEAKLYEWDAKAIRNYQKAQAGKQ